MSEFASEAEVATEAKIVKVESDESKPPFDPTIHLHCPTPNDEQLQKIEEMKKMLAGSELYERHKEWADDQQILRFLIARNFKVQQSFDLINEALNWREKRQPDQLDQVEGWEVKMAEESETGKIYNAGHDRWGRSLLIFDNTVQNTPNSEDHMRFLAWNLEFATKLMKPGVDKYCIFMHLESFSFWNTPPFRETRETIQMVCSCYPERLGHCIAYRPPYVFKVFFDTVKGFLDPKTVSKMIFIHGDVSDGSENDKLLRRIIGDDWKIQTGAEQPRVRPENSPGYNHDKFWPTVMQRWKMLQESGAPALDRPADLPERFDDLVISPVEKSAKSETESA